MKNNRIFNVVSLINRRYQDKLIPSENVIKDLTQIINETRGKDYITNSELISIVNLMSKYSNE